MDSDRSTNPEDGEELKEKVLEARGKQLKGLEEKKTKREELLKQAAISLWVDTYDDIFSDFDPRPYSERTLSDDFLYEAKKAIREKKSGRIELRFLIPKDKRNLEDEKIIDQRLHDHFKKHYHLIQKEVNETQAGSVLYIVIGLAMMIAASYVSSLKSEDIIMNMLFVVLEPAGWFVTWFSLDKLFYTSNRKKDDLGFYKKMTNADIKFTSY